MAAFLVTGAVAGPLTFGPGVPSGMFRTTVFTSGISFPYGMVQLDDGSLLVGSTTANSAGGFTAFYAGSGQLLRFTDTDQNGIADGPGSVVATVDGAITGVKQIGDLIAVSTTGNGTLGGLNQTSLVFFRPGATPADPLIPAGSLNLAYPGVANSITIASRPDGNGNYDVFFALGADYTGTPNGNVAVSGLASASLPTGGVFRFTITNTGFGPPSISNLSHIANGIRNVGGFLVDPATGNLYFNDNGYENGPVPISADELNLLTSAQMGDAYFGYPDNYTAYGSGAFIGGNGIEALVAFQVVAGAASFGAVPEPATLPAALLALINVGLQLRVCHKDNNPFV